MCYKKCNRPIPFTGSSLSIFDSTAYTNIGHFGTTIIGTRICSIITHCIGSIVVEVAMITVGIKELTKVQFLVQSGIVVLTTRYTVITKTVIFSLMNLLSNVLTTF